MQRGHVGTVKVDVGAHSVAHERLEHLEHDVKHPSVVDDVDLAGALRHGGLFLENNIEELYANNIWCAMHLPPSKL